MNENDLRVIKTKRTIQSAFLELLEQASYDDITVQDIVSHALINRATFYRHYPSKSELVDDMNEEIKQYYQERINQRFSSSKPLEFFQQYFAEFYSRRKEILALWTINNRRHHLQNDMQRILEQAFLRHPSSQTLNNREYQATLFGVIAQTNLKYWLNQPVIPDIKQTFIDIQQVFNWIKAVS